MALSPTPTIQAFDFSRLPKLSSRHIAIVEALTERYPLLNLESAQPAPLEALSTEIQEPIQLKFVGFSEKTADEFIRSLPTACVTVQLSVEPQEEKIYLDIDPRLSHLLVQKALGNSDAKVSELRALTPIEQGVLEFLILRSIQALEDQPGMLGPIAMRILKLANDPKMLLGLSSAEERGCVAKFYLGLHHGGGYIQIYLPHPIIEKVLLREDIIEGVFRPDQEDSLENQLSRVSHLKTSLWTEIGRVNLDNDDIAQLEKGDVILFDETLASSGLHGISGKAILRVGENNREGLLAELIDTEQKLILKILDFYGEEI